MIIGELWQKKRDIFCIFVAVILTTLLVDEENNSPFVAHVRYDHDLMWPKQ
jgi:hypothetical protein